MFCKQCGKEVAENAKFCGYCGANLTEEDVQDTRNTQNTQNTETPVTAGNNDASLASGIQTLAGAVMAILLFFPIVTIHIGYGHDMDMNAFQRPGGYLMIVGVLAAFEPYLRPYLKLKLGNFANVGSPILCILGLIIAKMDVASEVTYTFGGMIIWVMALLSLVNGFYLLSRGKKN